MGIHQGKHPEYVEGCFGCKISTISVGTVPGGAKDARSKIAYGKKMERNLDRYRERKQNGDNPSGISDASVERDRKMESIAERRPDLAPLTGRGE